jgi:hypothetical protein
LNRIGRVLAAELGIMDPEELFQSREGPTEKTEQSSKASASSKSQSKSKKKRKKSTIVKKKTRAKKSAYPPVKRTKREYAARYG